MKTTSRRRLTTNAGPPRGRVERVAQHVDRYRVTWYVAAILAASVAAQFTIDGALHRIAWG